MAASSIAVLAPTVRAETNWVGGARIGPEWIYLKVKLADDGASAELHLPQHGLLHAPATIARPSSSALELTANPPGRAHLAGAIRDDRWSGAIELDGARGEFRLRPYRPASAEELARLAGGYRSADGGVVLVAPVGDGLKVVDLATGRLRVAWGEPGHAGEFLAALPLAGARPPALASARFSFAGEALVWREAGERRATRVRLADSSRVEIASGAVRLAATLAVPVGVAGAPAVVMIGGSGCTLRSDADHVQAALLAHGIAVLAADKRGCGESTGDEASASYDDLIGDASALVAWLARQPAIDPAKIGVWGSSEGAWLASVVAQRAHAAFALLVSGTHLRGPEQTAYWTGRSMANDGFAPAEVAAAGDYMRRLIAVGDAGGKGWEELEPRIRAARGARWAEHVVLPETLADLLGWKGYGFRPEEALAALRVPTLAVWGEADENVPAAASARRFGEIFAASGVRHRLEIYPRANHILMLDSRNDHDWPRSPGYPPAYLRDLVAFVDSAVGAR